MSVSSGNEQKKVAPAPTEAVFIEEDGWIFRERPGNTVECVGRAADAMAEMTPPNQTRHNYPSA